MMATPRSPHDRVFLSVSLSFVFVLGIAGCAAILTSCGSGGGGDSSAAPPLPEASVSVSPALATVAAGQEAQFAASVQSEGSTAVQWTLDGGAADGAVSANGLYRAPATVAASRIVTLRAVSAANPSRSGAADILLAATGRLQMLNGPTGVAVEPSGRSALVTEFETGEVSRVDLETGRVTTIAKGLLSPFGVLPEPGGSTALVTEWGAQRVTRVDLSSGVGTVFRTPLSNPAGMARESSGLVLLAEEGSGGKISRFSPTDNSRTELATGGLVTAARGIAVLNEGFTALVTSGTLFGKLAIVDIRPDPATHSAPSEIVIDGNPLVRPVGVAKPAASTTTALLADESLGKVFTVDFPDLQVTVRELASGLRKPRGIALEPGEGGLLVAEAGSGDVTRIALSTCGTPPCAKTRVASGLSKPLALLVEAGERTALVVEQDTGEVSRIDLVSGKVTTLAEGLHQPSGLAIESSGATALVAGVLPPDPLNFANKGLVERVHLDTGTRESLVDPTADMPSPAAIALLPGGTRALVTDPMSAAKLFVVDLDARTIAPLATSPPITHPNGFAVEPDGKTALVTDTSTGKLLRLTLPPCPTTPCPLALVHSGLQSPTDVAVEPGGATALVLQPTDLVRVSIAGPVLPSGTSAVRVATGLTNPRRVAIEPGGRTALVTEATPDGVRRITLK